MSTADSYYAKLALSYLEDRKTVLAEVTIEAVNLDLDEVVDALLAGLAATTGRVYTVEAATIVETVRRVPTPPEGIRQPVPARPVKRRTIEDSSRPVTPADESPRVTRRV